MARAVILMAALEAEEIRQEAMRTVSLRRRLREEARAYNLSDWEFQSHYRLSKNLVRQLCVDLAPHMSQPHRGTKVSVECKVLTALSFYATGSYQKPVGMSYLHGLSQPSVSNAVREVTHALNHPEILAKYIHFPQTRRERQMIINRFSDKFGFPGCIGCIDGTHVALIRPSDHEERFFNGKHYHSRNVQIICDCDLNILSIDASFGGATHDSHIWKNHELNKHLQRLHQGGENVWLLDALRPWILTPIVKAENGSPEEHYTKVHCSARNTVERCIGLLKARWRCLLAHRVLHYNHHTVARIINACAVLHNIANRARLPIPQLPPDDVDNDQYLQDASSEQAAPTTSAEETRQLERGRHQRDLVAYRELKTVHRSGDATAATHRFTTPQYIQR